MPKKNHEAFSLIKKQTPAGRVWYVKFWDSNASRYSLIKSTGIPVEGKRERRREAEETARVMFAGLNFTNTPEILFLDYVEQFWVPDSPYCREAANLKKKPLSVAYITQNHEAVRRHMRPFRGFADIALDKLTAGLIRDWMLWANAKGMSDRKINIVLQAMRIAVRYAVMREELKSDPFKNVKPLPEKSVEKGILTPAEVIALIKADVINPHWRLAILLGCLCGMRRGEVRGLQWGDIEDGVIHIQHNWVKREGLKTPKCGSTRTVPITASVQSLLDTVRNVSKNTAPQTYIFEQLDNPGIPVSEQYFRHALDRELSAIGIPGEWPRWKNEKSPEGYVNEQKRKNLTFHSLRHTFVTLSRMAGITDIEIQALAGHKDARMMENYSHAAQVLDFGTLREKMNAAIEKGA
jgi:integrase